MKASDFKYIAQGLINATKVTFGSADPKVEEEAARRYEICLNCPLISESTTNCTDCGCVLAWKTRSDSNCPKMKW